MYGTVARMRIKPGAESQMEQQSREFEALKVPGFVTTYIYRMDADQQTYYMAVVFDSKESYFANARSPEQDARYQQMRALLESDPEWHDGEIVFPIA
jgi:antibiotic biosynthesis monooxygenase (ABM) superfamily enzyme